MTDSSRNVAVVRDQYAATNERDFGRAMSHYAPDVELIVQLGAGFGSIKAGSFRGREIVGDWFGDWFSAFDREAHFEIQEVTELEGGPVLLVAEHTARGRASGVAVQQTVVWLYGFRDGMIAKLQACDTREEAMGVAKSWAAPQ